PIDTLAPPGIHDTHSGIEHIVSPNVAPELSSPLIHYDADSMMYNDSPPTGSNAQITVAETTPSLHNTNTTIAPQPVFPSDPLLFALASEIPQSLPLPPDVRGVVDYVMSR
ncbi:hypothetical protein FRC11_002400, partial [Ceratobasidium sp. 423]